MTEFDDLVADWRLRRDGAAWSATMLPVRTDDGSAAVLVLAAAEHAHLVLRRWNGVGAVRLLRADPHRCALLVERYRREDLTASWDIEACHAVAELYPWLHVSALPQLPSLTTILPRWADEFAALPRRAPIPHRLVERAAALSMELADEPAEHALHGNLHYGTVVAADRAPWLAISPTPLNGDPHYEVAPLLWHRLDELAGWLRDGVGRRFHAVVDAAGFDADRARAWVILRVMREAVLAMHAGADLTPFVMLAKAVDDT